MMKKLLLVLGIIILIAVPLAFIDSCNAGVTKGRAISLKVLEKKLENCMGKGDCPDEFLQLSGIKKVLGYVIDEKNSDIILYGKSDGNSPPLHLEDFVIALRNEWLLYARKEGNTYYYSSPGCTIDPAPRVLEELQQTSGHISNNQDTAKVQEHLEQWHNVCKQPQKVGVFGIPFDTHFSKVMVDADYYMKRLVDGSVSLDIHGFASLSDITLDIAKEDLTNGRSISIPLQTMNRFWFYPGENSYREDKGIILIERSQVRLLTEEEFLTKEGKVAGSGSPNPLAKQFADEFTEKYAQIAKARPIYQELEGLFRFVSLAKTMKFKEALSEAGIGLEYLLYQFPIEHTRVDATLPGISNVKEFQHRTDYSDGYSIAYLWLPSCGGVTIDIKHKMNNFVRDKANELEQLKRIILSARPSLASTAWNYPRRRNEDSRAKKQSSSPMFVNLYGRDINGKWIFVVKDRIKNKNGYHELNDGELQKYVQTMRASGRGSFIITNARDIGDEDEFRDAYKRGGETGRFLRKLNEYGANAVITSDHELAYKKVKKGYPPIIKDGKPNLVVLDGLPGKRFNKIKNELDNYSKTGITIKDIKESDYIVKEENLVVIVAPFSWQLLENIEEKSKNGFFNGKMVALVVCGPKKNSANQQRYLKAIDVITKYGGRGVYSFEDTIWGKEGALLFKEFLEIINGQIKTKGVPEMSLPKAFDKAVKKTKEDNLIRNKRLDVRGIKEQKILTG